jgi:hypothetical protein
MDVGWFRNKRSLDQSQAESPLTEHFANSVVGSDFHRFQRDFDQNNADARLNPTKFPMHSVVKAKYSVQKLAGPEKTKFLKSICFDAHLPEMPSLRSSIEGDIKDGRGTKVTSSLLDVNVPTFNLVCRNDDSVGLVGREHERDGKNHAEQDNFFALVRGVGVHGSGEKTGGKFGFGKEVSYFLSQSRLVFYYSRLSKHASPSQPGMPDPIKSRLVGVNWLERDVTCPDPTGSPRPYQFKATFGTRTELPEGGEFFPCALYNDDADAFAKKLGLDVRSATDLGTTILIVDVRLPEGDEDGTMLLKAVADSYRMYYYPRFGTEPGCFQQFTTLPGATTNEKLTNPEDHPATRPFTSLLRHFDLYMDGKDLPEGVHFRERTLTIPKRGSKYPVAKEAVFVLGIQVEDGDKQSTSTPEPGPDKVAWIRGHGPVVCHERISVAASGHYHAILLSGDALGVYESKTTPAGNVVDPEGLAMAERLLAEAENVSHDKISETTPSLRDWHSATARVKELRSWVRSTIKELTSSSASAPDGFTADFKLSLGATPKPKEPRLITHHITKGTAQGKWTCKIDVPKANGKETNWKWQLKGSVVDEAGLSLPVPLKVVDGSTAMVLDSGKLEMEGVFTSSSQKHSVEVAADGPIASGKFEVASAVKVGTTKAVAGGEVQ